MALRLPAFTKPTAPRKVDPLSGVAVIRCKGCRKKHVSYGKAFCSKCTKEN